MTIGVIAPASGGDLEKIDKGIAGLTRYGFYVKEGRSMRGKRGYLAATDAERLTDIHRMFADRKIDAIMCMRGGYGTGRLIASIDTNIVKKNPKVFLGFSDITFLHLLFWKKTGLVTFNGPMLVSAFARPELHPFTISSFERTLMRAEAPGSVWQNHEDRWVRVVSPGTASGRLVGGNLSLVVSTLGTPYEIDTRGKIVFLEDVDEGPYRIDRMLTHLLMARKLSNAAAIVFGRNVPDKDTAPEEELRYKKGLMRGPVKLVPRKVDREYVQVIDETIADRLGKLGIPILIGLPFGHIDDYATMPIGAKATVQSRTGDLTIDEPVVK